MFGVRVLACRCPKRFLAASGGGGSEQDGKTELGVDHFRALEHHRSLAEVPSVLREGFFKAVY